MGTSLPPSQLHFLEIGGKSDALVLASHHRDNSNIEALSDV